VTGCSRTCEGRRNPGNIRTPVPGMLLLRQVPVQTAAEWDPPWPGFVAVDLVTHEGSVAGGEDACALDVTDVTTGWTETRAVRNKNQEHVVAALRGIRSSLPFPLLGIHSEYGSEFMNNHQGPLPSARAHHLVSRRKQRRCSGISTRSLTPLLSMMRSLQMNGTCGSLSSPGTKTNLTSFRGKAWTGNFIQFRGDSDVRQ